MSTLVIARRELAEKRFVFVTAVVMALVPFVGLLLPGVSSWDPRTFVANVGGVVAVGFTLGLAVMLGTSAIGRDLSEKRLSFYFAKPVSPGSIWFGKLTAAFVMLGGCFAILMLPVLFYGAQAWSASWNVDLASLGYVVGSLALVLFLSAHVLSTMIRSRSAIIALDGALAVAAGFAATFIVRRPYLAGALLLPVRVTLGILAGAVLILLGAGAWQLRRGGTDRLRNHIELSKLLWPALAAVLLVAAGYVTWVLSASPRDITRFAQIVQAKSGPWLFVEGQTAHRGDFQAKFLINANDGRWYRDRPAGQWMLRAAFSADGRHAAYLGDDAPSSNRLQLYVVDLDGTPEPVDTGITMSANSGSLVLSDDGSRLALMEGGLLRVIDLKTKRTAGAARLGKQQSTPRMFFATNDVVRIYGFEYGQKLTDQKKTMRIYEFDTAKRSLREISLAPRAANSIFPVVSPDGTTMLLRMHDGTPAGGTLVLADAKTGAPQATFPVRRIEVFGATLIDGSRVAYVTQDDAGNATLHVSGSDRTIDLGKEARARVVGQAGPRTLLVNASPSSSRDDDDLWSRGRSRSIIVDLGSGTITRRENVTAWGDSGFFSTDPRNWPATAAHTFLVDDPSRIFVTWNPLTGEKKPLLN